ncbi:MAG: PAS domain-containing sensor histidine kinase [Holosporales bacterium]|jgi:PAS domain S-box-containing protein|nr:PAS domain-containing sensor histidine kinase [Holosporales bacterium]
MQKENVKPLQGNSSDVIEMVSASFRNLSIKEPIKNSVIIFWESHTKNPTDKHRTQATIDLIYKRFDIDSCEKYEIRTGYLNRYNYLTKPREESTIQELEIAIEKGEEEQTNWLRRCEPRMPGFIEKNWSECVNEIKNPHFIACRELLRTSINTDIEVDRAFTESVNNFVSKNDVNAVNSMSYLVEENAWILTLPLLYPNRQVYIIHIGNVTESTMILFSKFSYLRDSTRILLPTFSNERFNCMADFLMEYKNKRHYGYSHPVDDSKTIGNFIPSDKRYLTSKDLLKMFLHERSEKELLSLIISKMPGHVYWHNRDGVYLGCNDLQAQQLGLDHREEIVGKTNRDFLSEKEAREVDRISKHVIEKGVSHSVEEILTMQGKTCNYLSHKVPLFNSSHTKVVGLLGISIDITDRKRAELLEKENAIQKKFKKLAEQMQHDIRTPLQTLSMILKVSAENIPEKKSIALRESINSIKKIAQVFLEYSPEKEAFLDYQHILVSKALVDVVDQKEMQYMDQSVKFQYSFDSSLQFCTFIYGNAVNFERMMSNIINNSVEATKGRNGVIKLSFSVDDDNVKITIQDNGIGMPTETVEKLMRNESVSSTKEGGYGIGTGQIRDALKEFNGTQFIESTQNLETKITLTIPKSDKPKWAIEQINLRKDHIVVILDDDVQIHNAWKDRLEKYIPDISLKFFENGQETVDFINSSNRKGGIFLLSDYELRNQKLNGLDVIEKSDIKRFQSVLVSSMCSRKEIQDKAMELGIRMLPKVFIENIPIVLGEDNELLFEKVDMVIVDDEKNLETVKRLA